MRFLIVLGLLLNQISYAKCNDKPVEIAVVDTGFGYTAISRNATRLCKTGHKDFTSEKKFLDFPGVDDPVPTDFNGHGTNVIGIIEEYAKRGHVNYCIVVLKYYSSNIGHSNLQGTVDAFQHALDKNYPYLNYSSGGSTAAASEKRVVISYLDTKNIFVMAAGNEGRNLDLKGSDYYPAKYDGRAVVVGMLLPDRTRAPGSNYGSVVNRWEFGKNITGYGLIMSGTSQATAVAMGKIVSKNKNKCDKVK